MQDDLLVRADTARDNADFVARPFAQASPRIPPEALRDELGYHGK